jgi:hypothetical protein
MNDLAKPNVLVGLAVVAGAALLVPILVPAIGRLAKPAARGAARAAGVLLEKGREAGAELMEVMEDVLAEPKTQLEASAAAAPAAVSEARELAAPGPAPDAVDATGPAPAPPQ